MRSTKTRKIIGGLTLATALLVTPALGFAQAGQAGSSPTDGKRGGGWGRHGHGDGIGRLTRGLDLSDAQQAQVQEITKRHRESTANLREQLRSLHTGGGELSKDGQFNESAVRAAAQARATTQVELEVAQARMMSEIHVVLTPEQKARLAERRRARSSGKGRMEAAPSTSAQ